MTNEERAELLLKIEKVKVERELLRRKAKVHFYSFCRYMMPKFYKKDREHLKLLCEVLQQLIENKLGYKNLIINMPPRHGKSLTLSLFAMWCIGNNPSIGIMTISYNDNLSNRFSRAVRNGIEATKQEHYISIFKDVFDNISIKRGDGAAQMWAVNDSHFTYLGSGLGGTITGLGCNIGIIDDPIKNADEAYNERIHNEHYDFYLNTFNSRVEEGGHKIVNMTRWASDDLVGKILENEQDYYVLKMPANVNGKMLCDELMSIETYEAKRKIMNPDIFEANYNQVTEVRKGKLYNKPFKTYKASEIFDKVEVIEGEIDYADKGSDFLCSIDYVKKNNKIYVIDIVFSDKSVDITHKLVAEQHQSKGTSICRIESNGGGSTFKVLVEKESKLNSNIKTVYEDFNRKGNKESRILSQSYWVMENVYFPERWQNDYNEFYLQLTGYNKEGKNLHDDAADCLSSIAERCNSQDVFKIYDI